MTNAGDLIATQWLNRNQWCGLEIPLFPAAWHKTSETTKMGQLLQHLIDNHSFRSDLIRMHKTSSDHKARFGWGGQFLQSI